MVSRHWSWSCSPLPSSAPVRGGPGGARRGGARGRRERQSKGGRRGEGGVCPRRLGRPPAREGTFSRCCTPTVSSGMADMPLVVRQRACAAPDPSPQPVGRSQPSAERSARRDRRRAACHRPCPQRLARGARPRPPVPLGEGQACASPQFGAVDWREHAHGGVAPPAPAAVPRCVSAAAGGRVFFSFRPLSPSRGPAGGAQSRPRAPPGRRWMNGPRSTARTRAARPGNCLPLAGAFQSRPAPPLFPSRPRARAAQPLPSLPPPLPLPRPRPTTSTSSTRPPPSKPGGTSSNAWSSRPTPTSWMSSARAASRSRPCSRTPRRS